MVYAPGAVERAMKAQEVIVRALAGEMTWIQAAEILGLSPRSVRRWRWRLEQAGYDGLFDRRRRVPSPKRAPVAEVERLLTLYRERYAGFNVRHFHQLARRQHGVRFCYAFVRKALQMAGLVAKHRPRGRHHRRREPRPCFGELVHLDGSGRPRQCRDHRAAGPAVGQAAGAALLCRAPRSRAAPFERPSLRLVRRPLLWSL